MLVIEWMLYGLVFWIFSVMCFVLYVIVYIVFFK